MIKYPDDFYNWEDALDAEDEVVEFVRDVEQCLRQSKEEYDWARCSTGNRIVIGFKRKEEIEIIVAKPLYTYETD